MPDSRLIFEFLTLLGWIMLGVVGFQLAWSIARLLLLPAVNGQAVGEVARVLAATLRAQRSPDLALLSLQSQLRWPMPWRLRNAARLLANRHPVTLVTSLAMARVLPAALIPGGHAAEAMGHAALIRWLDGLAGPVQRGRPWWRVLVPAISMLAVGTLAVAFITIVILPKYVQVFRELGMSVPHSVQAMSEAPRYLPWIWIGLAVAVVSAWWSLHRWRWHRQAWYDRGLLLATAGDHRFSEARLAELLGRSPAAVAAGAAGDLPGLAREAGWPCRSLPDLRQRYDDALRRRERLRQLAATAVPVLVTMILALPVWWYCSTLFGMLTGLIRTLSEQA